MESIAITYYWYLIIENKLETRIIKYSKSIYELLSLFRHELESKIYKPTETWLYKNNPTNIILAIIPIESLCLNPAQITMEIIDYYGLETIKQYTIAKIDHINNGNNIQIKLLHNYLPNEIMCEPDIDIELCLLDLINYKLDDIYKLLSEPDEHIYKLYNNTNIHVSWSQYINDMLTFNCLFYPPIEKMRMTLINIAFQTTFIKYNHCYNKYSRYFDT